MSRNIDSTLLAGLANANIQPFILAAITFVSGTVYVWSGVGNLSWNDQTWQGVGALGSISAISEGTEVQADGTTVTLSGIPTAGLTIPYTPGGVPPSGVTPPVTVPSGQSVAWALPTSATGSGTDTISGCSAFYSGTIAEVGTATTGGGFVQLTGNCGLGPWPTWPYAQWSSFNISLPPGSTIEAIYPVALITSTVDQGDHTFYADIDGTQVQYDSGLSSLSDQQIYLDSIGSDLSALESVTLGYTMAQTETGNNWTDEATISYIALAVYYTPPGTSTLITETTNDIQIGAPAQIYFGLMQDGAVLGTPYLAFGGTVDQPSIRVGPDTMTISLALENRLSNLQRANHLRYTNAVQRLLYPDDSCMSWVEMLSDEALRWGN